MDFTEVVDERQTWAAALCPCQRATRVDQTIALAAAMVASAGWGRPPSGRRQPLRPSLVLRRRRCITGARVTTGSPS